MTLPHDAALTITHHQCMHARDALLLLLLLLLLRRRLRNATQTTAERLRKIYWKSVLPALMRGVSKGCGSCGSVSLVCGNTCDGKN